jgi:hypothetical protein
VTRHTGRAVRSSIETELASLGSLAVVVLDFSQVRLIDLSCADEIFAKLLHGHGESAGPGVCFLARGLNDHQIEDIEEVLRRQRLVLVAESGGRLRLIGAVADQWRMAFERLAALGRAAAEELAADLAWTLDDARATLEQLALRRLVLEDSGHYLPPRVA